MNAGKSALHTHTVQKATIKKYDNITKKDFTYQYNTKHIRLELEKMLSYFKNFS